MAGRLRGKVALVIGAGSVGPGWGNGKATAVAFGREGAAVVCMDRNPEAAAETAGLVRAEGAQALALSADACCEDDVRRIVATTVEHYGAIDVLHNNVGLALLGGPVDISLQDWERSLDLNIGYMFLTVRHVLPVMERQGGGAIVNVSSIASIRWLGTAYIGYAAAKAAVNQFTQAIALQYANKGIRANAVLPGMMDTPIARIALRADAASEEELVARRHAASPTGAMGDAWDIAWASVYLASDEARYVNGVLLPVDGGMTCKVV
jgi:NAD(P)-dependent dehydrogenase (short-subunit alcohol dehydrogenase family)